MVLLFGSVEKCWKTSKMNGDVYLVACLWSSHRCGEKSGFPMRPIVPSGSVSVLLSEGHYNKLPHPGDLKQQKLILSQSGGQSLKSGCPQVGSFCRNLREHMFPASVRARSGCQPPWAFLTQGHIALVSASVSA